jgi:hypothetical protein
VENKNLAAPPEQLLENLSAGPAKIDAHGEAEVATGLKSGQQAVTKAKNCPESYEGRNKDDAVVRRVRCEETIDFLAELRWWLSNSSGSHCAV